jgi:hypothetical protein
MAKRTVRKGTSPKTTTAETISSFAAQGASPAAETVTLTWGDVEKALGQASAEERARYGVALGPDERLALGRRITSRKILTDFLRWSGQIVGWLGRTPAAAIKGLVGFSVGHVRVAVEDGVALRSMVARFEGRSAEVDVAEGGADGVLVAKAKAARADYDVLFTALDHATRSHAELSKSLTTAYSKATTAAPLAEAILLLCPLARRILKTKKSAVAERLAEENVTIGFVDALDAAGTALKEAAERAEAPYADGPVTERDLDLQDGTCIAHMQWLFDYFEALHAKDPSAPHLVPIATRSLFGPHTAAAPAAAPAAPPAEPGDPQKKPT